MVPLCSWKNSSLLLGEDAWPAPEFTLIPYEEKHFCLLLESNPDSPITYPVALLLVPILTELPAT